MQTFIRPEDFNVIGNKGRLSQISDATYILIFFFWLCCEIWISAEYQEQFQFSTILKYILHIYIWIISAGLAIGYQYL